MSKLYMLYHELWGGCTTWTEKFMFHARNQTEADNKATGWARYHSFYPGTVKALVVSNEEAKKRDKSWIHDEWVD
jgi:hypothetical protein